MADPGPLLGALIELVVGPPAHGGHCVARHEGRVVFVRHALPGERVRALVTEDHGGSFCRADAVEVVEPSPDRVTPPCPSARPGGCGGCDWQHASAAAQRRIKSDVVREQFRRVAGVDVEGVFAGVEALPGDTGLLGWRTRIAFAVGRDGRAGLHRHRSHQIEHVVSCPLGVPGVGDAGALRQEWPGLTGIEVVCDSDGAVALLGHRPGPGRQARGRRPPDRVSVVGGPERLRYQVGQRSFAIAADGFWQVHPSAAETFGGALVDAITPRAGETVLDLYAGAGPLTAVLAEAVGPSGRVVGIESSRQAVADAAGNLADLPWAEVRRGRVDAGLLAALVDELGARPDLVVLDPPRAGAGAEATRALVQMGPRAIGYVACDPASLARDVRVALDAGWRLHSLRGFDAFPMTHHVECVAVVVPA